MKTDAISASAQTSPRGSDENSSRSENFTFASGFFLANQQELCILHCAWVLCMPSFTPRQHVLSTAAGCGSSSVQSLSSLRPKPGGYTLSCNTQMNIYEHIHPSSLDKYVQHKCHIVMHEREPSALQVLVAGPFLTITTLQVCAHACICAYACYIASMLDPKVTAGS